MSLFKSSSKEAVLVIDIGSGSVASAITILSKGGKPKIICASRFPLVIDEKPSATKLFGMICDSLRKALAQTSKDSKKLLHSENIRKISKTHCSLTSPWHISQTKVLVVNKQNKFQISKKYIDDLIKNESVVTDHSNQSVALGLKTNSLTVVEQKIIQTKLNGYSTGDPYGKKTRSLELSMFTSRVPEKVVLDLEDNIHKYFPHIPISFHTFPLVSTTVIRDIFFHENNFLVIDVTGEITDLTIVHDGIALETASFPLGRNSLIRMLMESFGVNSEIALSFLSLYIRDKADESLRKQIQATIVEFTSQWRIKVNDIFKDFSSRTLLPNRIFITALEDVLALFLEVFEPSRGKNSKKTDMSNSESFSATVLDFETISHFSENNINVFEDPFLAIESIFLNKLFQIS